MEKTDILAYIPQINVPGFIFPNFACDLSSVQEDPNYIGWKEDELNTYDEYNLVKDPFLEDIYDIADSENNKKPVFSIVKYWPSSEDQPKATVF